MTKMAIMTVYGRYIKSSFFQNAGLIALNLVCNILWWWFGAGGRKASSTRFIQMVTLD